MEGRKREAPVAKLGLDLEGAAGIAGDEELRRKREDVVDLARSDLLGAFRLDEVVDAGAPATLLGVGNVEEGQPGNPAKKLAGLLDDPLGVPQVTGVVHR